MSRQTLLNDITRLQEMYATVNKKYKQGTHTAEDLKELVEQGRALRDALDADTSNPAAALIAGFFDEFGLGALEQEYMRMTGTSVPKQFSNGKFDLFQPNFFDECQAYFEDIGLNASKKSKKALHEARQVMIGLPEDFKGLRAENAQEQDFIDNLPGQTTLLLKIVERQLAVKDTPRRAAPRRKSKDVIPLV